MAYDLLYNDWQQQYLATKADKDKPEDFLSEELAIAAALGYAVSKNADETIKVVMNAVENNLETLDGVLVELDRDVYSKAYGDTEDAKVIKSLERQKDKGVIAAGVVLSTVRDVSQIATILEGLRVASKYYTNTYFNTRVIPELQEAVRKYLLTGVQDGSEYQRIRMLMEARLKSVPYWRVVANAGASRAYHYGMLKAGRISGQRGYRLVAVIDSVTSDICLRLDGREFWIDDALYTMETVAQAESPQDVKRLMPWVKPEKVTGVSSRDLAAMGVLVPPFHGNCRTTIELINTTF